MSIRLGIGIDVIRNGIARIIAAFKARVLADSGTFEAESCLNTSVQDLVNKNLYDSASLIVTPNGVKSGKIYSLKGTDLTFTRASVANRTNSVGVLESMATGVPRIEYPIGGGCPSILLEPQRTNLCIRSYQAASWNGSGYTGTNGTAQAPNGASDASTIVLSSGGFIRAPFFTFTESTIYAASVYVKNINLVAGNTFKFYFNNNSGGGPCTISGTIDLVNGTIGSSSTVGCSNITRSIENLGNGWFRLVILFTSNAGTGSAIAEIGFDSISIATGSINMWGAQMEIGGYASSPILTAGAAVTRLGDVANISSASSLIGQTSGVAYFEAKINNVYISGGRVLLVLSDGTSSNRLIVYIPSAGDSIDFLIQTGGVTQVNISKTALVAGNYKVAVAYANNDAVMYVNGVQIGTDSSVTIPAMSKINIGSDQSDSNQPNALIKIVALYTSRLSNAQLISQTI